MVSSQISNEPDIESCQTLFDEDRVKFFDEVCTGTIAGLCSGDVGSNVA
jgi:hypothetical protein